MKLLLLVTLFVGLASAQFPFRRGPQRFRRPQFRPQFFQQPFRGQRFQQPQFQRQFGQPQGNAIQGGGASHGTLGNSQYHYSWRVDGRKFTGQQAAGYCQGLGNGWRPVSINSQQENSLISGALSRERQEYTWTGARGSRGGFIWDDGTPVTYSNWSGTGGAGRRQPDNREGNEACLAILNNFYGDGVVWHDVACHHLKPIVCERKF